MNIVIITAPYYPEMSAPAACINKYIQQLKYKYSIDIINRSHGRTLSRWEIQTSRCIMFPIVIGLGACVAWTI